MHKSCSACCFGLVALILEFINHILARLEFQELGDETEILFCLFSAFSFLSFPSFTTLPFWVQIIIWDNCSWNLLLITALRLKTTNYCCLNHVPIIFMSENQELLNYIRVDQENKWWESSFDSPSQAECVIFRLIFQDQFLAAPWKHFINAFFEPSVFMQLFPVSSWQQWMEGRTSQSSSCPQTVLCLGKYYLFISEMWINKEPLNSKP